MLPDLPDDYQSVANFRGPILSLEAIFSHSLSFAGATSANSALSAKKVFPSEKHNRLLLLSLDQRSTSLQDLGSEMG